MSKPYVHAVSSARRWGGTPADYLPIHDLLDSSKGAIGDSRHRALTHTTWFLSVILERVFGTTITISTGRVVSVRDVGEQHILEDYGGRFIPTPQDFLHGVPLEDWMLNGRGEPPASVKQLDAHARRTRENERRCGTCQHVRSSHTSMYCGSTASPSFQREVNVSFDTCAHWKKRTDGIRAEVI